MGKAEVPHQQTRSDALRQEASRLRIIAEDLEYMAVGLERTDAGYEVISTYQKI